MDADLCRKSRCKTSLSKCQLYFEWCFKLALKWVEILSNYHQLFFVVFWIVSPYSFNLLSLVVSLRSILLFMLLLWLHSLVYNMKHIVKALCDIWIYYICYTCLSSSQRFQEVGHGRFSLLASMVTIHLWAGSGFLPKLFAPDDCSPSLTCTRYEGFCQAYPP